MVAPAEQNSVGSGTVLLHAVGVGVGVQEIFAQGGLQGS